MIKKRRPIFKFKPFSRKQRMVLNWWTENSPVKDYDGVIADGAIRSGKTVSMSLSFVFWAMENFNGENFIMAGKTISSFQRNVLTNLKTMLRSRGYHCIHHISGETPNMMEVSRKGVTNYFYIFGGKDEGSQDLVQGITAAGAFFDEVALMPESFVNQATGRCSVEGAKWWFNCNPGGPLHWFKVNWIDKCRQKKLLYLHFTMDDNLSLSEKIKAKYRSMYAGVFFLRYIKGLWKTAEGLIYTMFTDANLYDQLDDRTRHISNKVIAVDYGTTNPCVFLETWDDGETIWVEREYRWDSRSEEARRSPNPQKTDAQYADDMAEFMGSRPADQCLIIVDPSAASFIQELRSRGWVVKEADNEVLDGIRKVGALYAKRQIRINRNNCKGLISETQSYVWDDKAAERGEEKPVKQLDHGPDALRYRVNALPAWRIGI
ncbi:MAG TPA: PBSX family phage terminase large subunit [Candidatus Cottocaccamicrobium excrementipullorum]|nr:PBSX family phage terminase large subunit [Candidatus Cottocaccamicrobium excrementipullorum]